MNDPSVPFAAALNELVAIRQDLEQGRVAVDDLPQVLERAGELVERGRAVLDEGCLGQGDSAGIAASVSFSTLGRAPVKSPTDYGERISPTQPGWWTTRPGRGLL